MARDECNVDYLLGQWLSGFVAKPTSKTDECATPRTAAPSAILSDHGVGSPGLRHQEDGENRDGTVKRSPSAIQVMHDSSQ